MELIMQIDYNKLDNPIQNFVNDYQKCKYIINEIGLVIPNTNQIISYKPTKIIIQYNRIIMIEETDNEIISHTILNKDINQYIFYMNKTKTQKNNPTKKPVFNKNIKKISSNDIKYYPEKENYQYNQDIFYSKENLKKSFKPDPNSLIKKFQNTCKNFKKQFNQ